VNGLRLHGLSRLFKLLLLLALPLGAMSDFGPKYLAIKDLKKQKAAFVQVMLPKITAANSEIIKERRFIKKFFDSYLLTYNAFAREDIIRLHTLAKKYRIKHVYDEKAYLKKIAPVPVSLVLAQAAVESAWGKSRFVELANNIFGEWTYGKKGIIPEDRPEGMTHKIKVFDTIKESVASYMLNLNRHAAYKEFRNKRALYTKSRGNFTGLDATDTMEKYSGIGEKYNELLKTIITSNRFFQFDNISAQIGMVK